MLVAVGVLWGTGVFTPSQGLQQESAPQDIPTLEQGPAIGGALDKTIDLNQVQTAGRLSITLEQMTLSPGGITFSAFTTPPDYRLLQDSQSSMSPGVVRAVAEYSIDGITINAGDAEVTFIESGIQLTWSHNQLSLDLVPSDATEIVLTVISFGDWQGPWEFIIPLQD
jgi:hypothetical protein